nr:MAG TPA: hypothetical protein [Caudoviricetes sp.]
MRKAPHLSKKLDNFRILARSHLLQYLSIVRPNR